MIKKYTEGNEKAPPPKKIAVRSLPGEWRYNTRSSKMT